MARGDSNVRPAGNHALDPEVVSQLLARSRRQDLAASVTSPRWPWPNLQLWRTTGRSVRCRSRSKRLSPARQVFPRNARILAVVSPAVIKLMIPLLCGRRHPMKGPSLVLITCTLFVLETANASAGPCSQEIVDVTKTLAASDAGSGPTTGTPAATAGDQKGQSHITPGCTTSVRRQIRSQPGPGAGARS